MNILFVDYDEDMRHMLQDVLNEFGYIHSIVDNGHDALKDAPFFSCLITDWMMPEMSGIQLCKRVREINPNIYIIFLTGRADKEDMLEGLVAGANDYLTKPVDINELQLRLHLAEAHIALNKIRDMTR